MLYRTSPRNYPRGVPMRTCHCSRRHQTLPRCRTRSKRTDRHARNDRYPSTSQHGRTRHCTSPRSVPASTGRSGPLRTQDRKDSARPQHTVRATNTRWHGRTRPRTPGHTILEHTLHRSLLRSTHCRCSHPSTNTVPGHYRCSSSNTLCCILGQTSPPGTGHSPDPRTRPRKCTTSRLHPIDPSLNIGSGRSCFHNRLRISLCCTCCSPSHRSLQSMHIPHAP